MRIVRRREDEDTKRLIRTLREQLAESREETRVQVSANALMARRQDTREGTLAGAHAALAAPYRQVQQENEQLRTENKRLRARLDDALGRSPEDRAAIEAGTGEPIRRASA